MSRTRQPDPATERFKELSGAILPKSKRFPERPLAAIPEGHLKWLLRQNISRATKRLIKEYLSFISAGNPNFCPFDVIRICGECGNILTYQDKCEECGGIRIFSRRVPIT
jgi:hypothetical protein